MKKSVALLLVSLFTSSNAVAQEAQPEQKPGAAKELKTMVNSLSNLLAATNPPVPEQPSQAEYQQKVSNLPSLVKPVGAPEPVQPAAIRQQSVPEPMALPQPTVQIQAEAPRLSPETKRILRTSGNRLGDREVYKKESLIVERGQFDPEFGALSDQPIDTMETVTPPEPEKPRFDIEVKNTRTTPTTAEEIMGQGLAALRAGQYEAAIASYKAALIKDGKNRDALFGLATAYHKANQRAQAKAAYAKLLSVYPKYEPGWNNFIVLASEEAPNDALVELNNLSARNPNFAPIFAQKAVIYSKTGDVVKAKENYMKAVNLQPDNLDYRYNLAVLLDQTGDAFNAVKIYNGILEEGNKGSRLPVDSRQIKERVALIGRGRNS